MKQPYHSLYSLIALFLLAITALPAQVVINEISCSNQKQFVDDHSDYNDWFELYNAGINSVNIGGYWLSDSKSNNQKWQIPAGTTIGAGGFLRFWASGRDLASPTGMHTNFNLTQTKANTERVVFSDPAGNVLEDKKLSQKTQQRHSYGRTTDGAAAWSVFTTPTPGGPNNTAVPYNGYADKPDADMEPGFYTGPVTVTLSTTEINGVIRYTLNGHTPTITSPIYTGPLTLTATTVLKAITFSPDSKILPGFLRVNTYFVNVNHTVPVISIAADDLDTLANGDSELPGPIGYDTVVYQGETYINPIYAKRRPIGSFEYFNLNKERAAFTYGEFDRHGQDSWAHSHRSLDFTSRDEMGYDYAIKEKLFELRARDEFQRIILRAAGDDNFPSDYAPSNEGAAHIRDAYVQNLALQGGMQLDVRTATKAVVYLNGQYWGLYDIRERTDDADYTKYYYNQDKYHVQYISTWGNTWSEYGGQQAQDDWNDFRDNVMGLDVTQPANYQYVTDNLDVLSMMDYMILNSFTVCTDWLNYNVGWWRGLDPNGTHKKWGFTLWDNDAVFGFYINYTGVPDQSATAAPCNIDGLTDSWPDVNGHMQLFNHLRTNPDFEQLYITRQLDMWNTTFSCENMLHQLDSVIAVITPEMPLQCSRWSGDMSDWVGNVNQLHSYIEDRCSYIGDGLQECHSLSGPYALTINAEPAQGGFVKLNTLIINQFPWNGTYYGGVNTNVEAVTKANYYFQKWTDSATPIAFPDNKAVALNVNLTSATTITAHFSTSQVPTTEVPEHTPSVQVFPTLVRTTATVQYTLPESALVNLRLYDAAGRQVVTIATPATSMQAGTYTANIDLSGANLTAGAYILEFSTGTYRASAQLIYQP